MSTVAAGTAATFCATLVDEWWRSGVREAVVCPGSRSTPLALALLRHEGMGVSVRLDERGAGYFALGLALASGRATVVLTTSGTAAVELHPAVVEAHHARVPLLICTADRPFELQGVGAAQTIDQAHLFGPVTRWFADLGVPDEAARPAWRSIASRAVLESERGPLGPGPVHLNLAFREPLLGEVDELPPGRPGGEPWHGVSVAAAAPTAGAIPEGAAEAAEAAEGADGFFEPGTRGVVVMGGRAAPYAGAVRSLASRLGWPLLADPRSGGREAAPQVVGAADALLRHERFAIEMLPDRVLRLGDPWASKVLGGWLSRSAHNGARHLAVEPHWAWKDPGREVSTFLPELPGTLPVSPCESEWLGRWAAAEAAAEDAIDGVIACHSEATEPGAARALYAEVPGQGCIVVSSSMPVRQLEWFARPRPAPPRVLSNRGANGIDGVVSTILGVAASGAGDPVYGLLGDLAVLHDASALVRPASGRRPTPAVLVVLDNAGGGIFHFLPQAGLLQDDEFEQLFGTPQEPAVADLARGCGYFVTEIAEAAELSPALAEAAGEASATGMPAFVVVDTDRASNVTVHCEIEAAVSAALAGL